MMPYLPGYLDSGNGFEMPIDLEAIKASRDDLKPPIKTPPVPPQPVPTEMVQLSEDGRFDLKKIVYSLSVRDLKVLVGLAATRISGIEAFIARARNILQRIDGDD